MTTPMQANSRRPAAPAHWIPLDPAADAAMTEIARELRMAGSPARTAESYRMSLQQLAAHIAPVPVLGATRAHITGWLTALREHGYAAYTIETRFRHLRRFYNWCLDEEIITASPMARLKQPKLPEMLTPVLTDAELAALLATCAKDRTFRGLRDHAIMRVLIEAGTPRASELAALQLAHVNMSTDLITIYSGKGAVDRILPFGDATGRAVSRYLRARAARPGAAACPVLFVGVRAAPGGGLRPLTRSGVGDILEYRGHQAGLGRVWPHQFRHTSYHRLDLAGGSSGDAQKLYGWKSAAMCAHYGASGAARRAVEHARALAIGDTL